ncbi:MAG: hypothetical protein LC798_11155 [Chloroflexi bacterium]|nr:hypothetical protein [Chloroflexota bacterium]
MREKIIRIQKREKLNDREMAERLGIARSTWTSVKLGRLALSSALAMRAVKAFPELLPGLVMSLSASDADPDESADAVKPEEAIA